MDAFSAIVSDVLPAINDALNIRGGEVSNVGLSLINRARNFIWGYKPWGLFIGETTLTLDSSLEADAPSDFGRVYKITASSDIYKPVYSYNNPDKNYRYTFNNTITTTGGYDINFRFYGNTSTSVFMKYIKKIDAAVSDNAHYLLFPANLIIAAALWLHASDTQKKPAEVQLYKSALDEHIRDFAQFYNKVDETQILYQDDFYGNQILNDDCTMMGD